MRFAGIRKTRPRSITIFALKKTGVTRSKRRQEFRIHAGIGEQCTIGVVLIIYVVYTVCTASSAPACSWQPSCSSLPVRTLLSCSVLIVVHSSLKSTTSSVCRWRAPLLPMSTQEGMFMTLSPSEKQGTFGCKGNGPRSTPGSLSEPFNVTSHDITFCHSHYLILHHITCFT